MLKRMIGLVWEFRGDLCGNLPDNHVASRREAEHSNDLEPTVYSPDQGVFLELPEHDELTQNQLIEGQMEADGMDAIAWYRSYHYYPFENWGIYIREDGLNHLAAKIQQQMRGKTPVNAAMAKFLAFELIIRHETFHFLTDFAATILELGGHRYDAYYIPYTNNAYLASMHSSQRKNADPVEEAMANAFVFRSKNPLVTKQVKDVFKGIMDKQPKGYKGYKNFIGFRYGMGLNALGYMIRNPVAPGTYAGVYTHSSPAQTLFNCGLPFKKQVPLHIIPPGKKAGAGTAGVHRWMIIAGGIVLEGFKGDPHKEKHFHYYRNGKKERYLYDDLDPLKGSPALSGKEKKKIRRIFNLHKNKLKNKTRPEDEDTDQ